MRGLLLIIALAVLSGCSTKMYTTTYVPPKEPQVAKLKRIAVVESKGDFAEEARGHIEAVLSKSEYNGASIVQVVNRKDLKKILEEQKLQLSGLVDPSTMIEFGKLTGVDGILTVQTKTQYETRSYTPSFLGLSSSSSKNCAKRLAAANLKISIVDISRGVNILSKNYDGLNSSKSCGLLLNKLNPPKAAQILAIKDAVRDFYMDISPQKRHIYIDFIEDFDGLASEDKKQMQYGIEYMKNNVPKKACSIWTQVEAEHPTVVYYKGVCKEMDMNFSEALEYYQIADRMYGKPVDEVMKSIARVEKVVGNMKELDHMYR